MLELKGYQKRSLEELETYLRLTVTHGAKMAFLLRTERPYRSVPQLPDLPYVCLRVPTGGGKTLMACHALGIAAEEYLQVERTVCLWLTPTNTIRDQTLEALRNPQHPYRQVLDAQFTGQVTVMDLAEALYVQRGTLSGETCIVVSTLAALRVEDTDGRKVYESSGVLQHHFTALNAVLEDIIEKREDGSVPYSLANVLRLWRPVVIMDEAHNARTPLSFDTLARFKPSCVIEFTATPETTHNPERGRFASNILHHVSAAELKTEEMIKLPIKLRTRADWKEVVSDALQTQRDLEKTAREEEKETGEYIRPVVLFQAQPRSRIRETLNVDVIKKALIEDFKVPEEQIAVATSQAREIDDVDLFERDCPIRFIITVYALKEGWDCSFAYVLCSVAEIGATRAVEQILGRILRLPSSTRKKYPELNFSYAFVASLRFVEALNSLHDALVENGFERLETSQLVKPAEQVQDTLFPTGSLFARVTEYVSEMPDLSKLSEDLSRYVTFDKASGELCVTGVVTTQDEDALVKCFKTDEGKRAAIRVARRSRGEREIETIPSHEGQIFSVPQLAIVVEGQLELVEETHFLQFEWDLTEADATLSEKEFPLKIVAGHAGELDVSEDGKIVQFVKNVHEQLTMLLEEPGWTTASLVNWLDRQIRHPDLTRTQATLFIKRIAENLLEQRSLKIEQLARHKFRLRNAIAAKIDEHRKDRAKDAFQRVLFNNEAGEIEVKPEICFSYSEDRYNPNWYYEGACRLKKHYFPLIGELKSEGEELECAIFISQIDEVEYWVRNLERRPEFSLWLPTSTDRFYPDFVAKLKDGRILVVEYKGEHLWSNDDSKEKRAIGALWADRSSGKCLFVMPKGKDWEAISQAIQG